MYPLHGQPSLIFTLLGLTIWWSGKLRHTAVNVYSSEIWVSFNGGTYFTSAKSSRTPWNVKVHVEDKSQSVVGVEARKK
jgi:hypothetical protein